MALDDIETDREAILRELAKLRYLDNRFNVAITIISASSLGCVYCPCFTRLSDKRIAPARLRVFGRLAHSAALPHTSRRSV